MDYEGIADWSDQGDEASDTPANEAPFQIEYLNDDDPLFSDPFDPFPGEDFGACGFCGEDTFEGEPWCWGCGVCITCNTDCMDCTCGYLAAMKQVFDPETLDEMIGDSLRRLWTPYTPPAAASTRLASMTDRELEDYWRWLEGRV